MNFNPFQNTEPRVTSEKARKVLANKGKTRQLLDAIRSERRGEEAVSGKIKIARLGEHNT